MRCAFAVIVLSSVFRSLAAQQGAPGPVGPRFLVIYPVVEERHTALDQQSDVLHAPGVGRIGDRRDFLIEHDAKGARMRRVDRTAT